MRFWQAAASDYVESQHRLAAAVGACAQLSGLNGAQQPRDYIAIPDLDSPAPAKRSERKAA
jgi:hypothetical protein